MLLVIALGFFGVMLGAILLTKPKLLIGTTFISVLFVRTVSHLSGLEAVDSVDDALVVLCVLRAFAENCKRDKKADFTYPGLLGFFLFFLLGVFSGLLGEVPFADVLLPGAFLAMKGLFFGWSVAQFDWSSADLRQLMKFGAVLGSFILLLSAINAAIPGPWNSVFSTGGVPIERYGLPSLLGPFIHPFDLAFSTSMCAIAALAYRQHIRKNRISAFLLTGGLIATALSFRRKDLIGVLVASVRFIFRFSYTRMAILAVPTIALIGILSWQEIVAQVEGLSAAYLTVTSEEARTVLTLGAVTVASEAFPLGTGFGRYGSRTAAVEYSPEYHALGFPSVHGLGVGPIQGAFLTDTSWPAVIGETGFLGALCFCLGLLMILLRSRRWEKEASTPEGRWIGSTAVGWFILTMFQSLGSATFTSPPMFAFFFGLIGIGVAIERREKISPVSSTGLLNKKGRR